MKFSKVFFIHQVEIRFHRMIRVDLYNSRLTTFNVRIVRTFEVVLQRPCRTQKLPLNAVFDPLNYMDMRANETSNRLPSLRA